MDSLTAQSLKGFQISLQERGSTNMSSMYCFNPELRGLACILEKNFELVLYYSLFIPYIGISLAQYNSGEEAVYVSTLKTLIGVSY